MKRFVRVLFLILAISIVALSFGCPATTTTPTATTEQTTAASPTAPFQPIKLVLSTSTLPTQGFWEQWAWIAKRIPEATGGKVQIVHYPNASLFLNQDAVDAIMLGGADFTHTNPGFLLSVLPVLAATTNIMLYENEAHVHALWTSEIGDELWAKLEKERGIKFVAFYSQSAPTSYRNSPIFNSVRPINKLEDFKGLKIRLPPNKVQVDSMTRLGVSVISIPVSDAPTALMQHMIDGLLTNWQFVTTYSLDTLTPYALDESIAAPPGSSFFIANLKTWNRLPPDVQKAIQDVMNKDLLTAFPDLGKILNVPGDEGIAKYRSNPKNQITRLSNAERARWQAILKPYWQETAKADPKSGDLGQRILDKIEELRPQFVGK